MGVDRTRWLGSNPEFCDICESELDGRMIDGRTVTGPWAIMCEVCHVTFGTGLGTGKGQLYEKDKEGLWWKLEG